MTFLLLSCTQITIIQGVLSDINMKKGESECQYYINKLEYLDDRQRDGRIEQCKSLLCHGELRNKSGTVSSLKAVACFYMCLYCVLLSMY